MRSEIPKIEYDLINQSNFSKEDGMHLAYFLEKQGRVRGNLLSKIDRCKIVCFASSSGERIGVGAIKKKTSEDFNYAELPELAQKFDWELGYFYTENEFTGLGIGKGIASRLIKAFGEGNLMASTEFENNPSMDRILVSNGFKLFGKSWTSRMTGNKLGLYLKMNE